MLKPALKKYITGNEQFALNMKNNNNKKKFAS